MYIVPRSEKRFEWKSKVLLCRYYRFFRKNGERVKVNFIFLNGIVYFFFKIFAHGSIQLRIKDINPRVSKNY